MKIINYVKYRTKQAISIWMLPIVLVKYIDLVFYYKNNKKKISIILLYEHIGDIIACEPVSDYLKNVKKTKVVWLVNYKYASILSLFDNVDKIVGVSSISEIVYLKYFLSSFSVYNLHFDSRLCTKYYLHLHNDNSKYNINNYFNKGSLLEVLSETANLPRLRCKPHLALAQSDRFPELDFPFVAIHLVANDETRNWDKKKWQEFIVHYPDIKFVEIGLTASLPKIPNYIYSYCGKLSLVDVAYLINKSMAFVGIESSMGHYANALSKPSLIMMGKFHNFTVYNPYSVVEDNFRMIHFNGPVKDLPVEMVCEEFDLIIKRLRCL